jgi:hypothetical protein
MSEHEDGTAFLQIKTGQVFLANRIAAKIWQSAAQGKTAPEIATQISQECGVKIDGASKNVACILSAFVKQGLLKSEGRPKLPHRFVLLAEALWELFRYDVETVLFGFNRVYRTLSESAWRNEHAVRNHEDYLEQIVGVASLAVSLYWKPAKCLQTSIAVARQLRKYGVPGQLVIGYRPAPFFGHAWVEVNGKIVNDYEGFARHLQVLAKA